MTMRRDGTSGAVWVVNYCLQDVIYFPAQHFTESEIFENDYLGKLSKMLAFFSSLELNNFSFVCSRNIFSSFRHELCENTKYLSKFSLQEFQVLAALT